MHRYLLGKKIERVVVVHEVDTHSFIYYLNISIKYRAVAIPCQLVRYN